ncbi:PIN domain-containing protein [Geminocystis sp. GBBB08]|uniref:PIN domain-containing protein n=1 Tax=Geminocystis sp. GBBB08 TaxID=2604140 RepID=UPI0027E27B53|nr:PIN domain-containing protein [Geminocystis sp. GBBB08]MBL1208973.1 PIN domain-containing protein [Geminocystis sp. GBBB08]
MNKQYLIYLDVCCLNRPFDDWKQDRNCLEGEAIIEIFKKFSLSNYQLINSEAIEAELKRMTNLDKLKEIKKLLKIAKFKVRLNQEIDERSQEIKKLGFGIYDSFHIACAEYAKVDILLTTDDRFLKKAVRYSKVLKIREENPVSWLMNDF